MTVLEEKILEAKERSAQKQQKQPPIQEEAEFVAEHESAYRYDAADAARRARTHRLVQIGALAEKYLNLKGMEITEIESILRVVMENNSL